MNMTFEKLESKYYHTGYSLIARCQIGSRVILTTAFTLLALTLYTQKIAVTPYTGLEAEIIKTAEFLTLGDQTVAGVASESIDWTFGLRVSYYFNERLNISLDLNKRTQYRYGYLITYTDPLTMSRGIKGVQIIGYDWLLASLVNYRLLSRGGIDWNGTVGTGGSKFYRPRPIVEMLPMNFGPGYEATTELWQSLNEITQRTAWVGLVGTDITYQNVSLNLRYIKSLTQSITPPFEFRGNTYLNRNSRNSIQLLLSYRFVLQ